MTPCEWAFYIEGYQQREEDAWQRTRAIYTLLYNINVDRHHQLSPAELMPLPSDAEQERNKEAKKARYLTDAERRDIVNMYKPKC